MSGEAMCPHCGWNFEADRPIELGEWRMTPIATELRGKPLSLTGGQHALIYAVAKAGSVGISRDALLNRISGSENANIVSVHLTRLRKQLGCDFPIQTMRGFGFRWNAAPSVRAA